MMNSPRAGKAASVTSSAQSNSSGTLSFLPRYTPRPEPAYISTAAACDHVTHLKDQEHFDPRSPAGSPSEADSALFGDQALSLLNTFLDALLYNFLTKGHGTSLSQLRPAITDVLKSKLAREALASADEELHGLIGEADADIGTEEELTASQFGGRSGWAQDWHLEMAFKRMRLRVMVFIRLGDFDDEDEDRFLEDEDEFRCNGERPPQDMDFLASPAAVYLASVLEHVAEQALTIAGEAAYARTKRQLNKRTITEDKELDNDNHDRVVVEEMDVEKIALNPTLGRLWRTWRKNYRTMHGASIPGGSSPPATPVPYRSRLGSLNEIAHPPIHSAEQVNPRSLDRHLTPDEIPEGDVSETDIAANIPLPMSENDIDEIEILGVAIPLPMSDNDIDEIEILGVAIPLPMGDNDVNEIEVPGLAKEISDDEEGTDSEAAQLPPPPKRPLSAAGYHVSAASSSESRPPLTRLRSNSAPNRARFPFSLWWSSPIEKGQAVLSEDPSDSEESPEEVPRRESAPEDFYDARDQPAEDHLEPEPTPAAEKPEEKTHDKVQSGIVAGALTGAAALVGTAIASVAGYGHTKSPSQEEVPATEKELSAVEDAATVAPTVAPTVVSKATDGHVAEKDGLGIMHDPEISSENGRAIQPRATLKDAALFGKSDDEVQAYTPTRTSQLQPPLEDTELKGATSADTDKTGQTTLPVANHEIPTRQSSKGASLHPPTAESRPGSMSEKDLVPAPLHPSSHDRAVLEELNGHDHEDTDAIGVAKTSNVPIHSHSPSPPPEQRSYYLPGSQTSPPQNNKIGFQGRNESPPPRPGSRDRNVNFSKDRPLVATDDYMLGRSSSGSRRNTGPSPLREVTKAEEAQLRSGVNGDTPHAVPFYHRPVDDDALKQEQATKRAAKDRAPNLPPPIQTNIAEPVHRPGSSYSTGGRSTSSTPPGHSAKGSTSSSVIPRSLDKRPSDESKRRDFDSLLKNDETVKYTLTPEDLRESNAQDSTLSTASRRSPPREDPSPIKPSSPRLASFPMKPASPLQPAFPKKPSSPLTGGFPKKPTTQRKVIPRVSSVRQNATVRPLTTRPEPMNTDTRKSGFLPREPRVITDDTRDFADFVRSTRPTTEQPLRPVVDVDKFALGPDPRVSSPRPGSTLPDATPADRSASRSKLVPREPDVKGGGSSDLIDFIREGPPSIHTNGQHRIPRTVAPFRSTMDSDDLTGLGTFGDFGSLSSPHTSFNPNEKPSIATTANSSSGLLSAQKGASPPLSQRPVQSSLSAPPPQIVRKTRRVKDPYAIDSDDEDDDFLTALPNGSNGRKPAAKEESLAEFLMNSEPPKANAPAPIKVPTKTNTRLPLPNGLTSAASSNGSRVNGHGPRPSSRNNSVSPQPSSAPAVRAPGVPTASTGSRVPMQKFEARAAGATKNGFGGNGFHYSMNDMADFLRSSGPPDSGAPSPDVPLSKKPSKRGRKFWQRA